MMTAVNIDRNLSWMDLLFSLVLSMLEQCTCLCFYIHMDVTMNLKSHWLNRNWHLFLLCWVLHRLGLVISKFLSCHMPFWLFSSICTMFWKSLSIKWPDWIKLIHFFPFLSIKEHVSAHQSFQWLVIISLSPWVDIILAWRQETRF